MAITKSPGQLAYEADCAKQPKYHDGAMRKTWDQLDSVCQWSWSRTPPVDPSIDFHNLSARRAKAQG